jgi:hypothetical protein
MTRIRAPICRNYNCLYSGKGCFASLCAMVQQGVPEPPAHGQGGENGRSLLVFWRSALLLWLPYHHGRRGEERGAQPPCLSPVVPTSTAPPLPNVCLEMQELIFIYLGSHRGPGVVAQELVKDKDLYSPLCPQCLRLVTSGY